ncbi:MAG: ferritin family protein [Desulfohalobiaceae bacterium]
MHVFSGEETLEDILILAYSLEQGLQDFYRLMVDKTEEGPTRELFEVLAGIEDKHKDRIYEEYAGSVSPPPDRGEFESKVVSRFMEGGMTTEEYFEHFRLDIDSRADILDMAMTIEAQALDLYRRSADRFQDKQITPFFLRLSDEEKEHLRRLGQLMEEIEEEGD